MDLFYSGYNDDKTRNRASATVGTHRFFSKTNYPPHELADEVDRLQEEIAAASQAAAIFPHAESFERIAYAIDAIWSQTKSWVTRDEIVGYLAADPEVQELLAERGGTEWHIGNAVDWFSQKITAGDSAYINQFARKKLAKKWAYAPSPDRLGDASPIEDLTTIAGPLQVYIDSDAYTAEEKGELLSLVSELYSLQFGDRLVIDSAGTAEPIPVEAGKPDGGFDEFP